LGKKDAKGASDAILEAVLTTGQIFNSFFGTFHETAKVVNSLFGETWRITDGSSPHHFRGCFEKARG